MNTSPIRLFAVWFVFALTASGLACNVPVFRYALDHWHPDPYQLELATRDCTDPEVARFVRNLGANSGLNLEIRRRPAESDPQGDAPSRLLRPPHGNAEPVPLWTGTINAQSLNRLADSPTRTALVSRLLQGDSAVWILVEGPDAKSNDAAAAVVEKRLRYLEQVVRLPVIDPNDPDSKLGPGPALKVAFSLLRISPSDPEEEALRAMLAGPRSGLEKSDQPWLAALFGRGRVLGAWPAHEMDDAAIEEVALFLVGACSCQVKRQNPGWDLLLHLDWDDKLAAMDTAASVAEPRDSTQKTAEEPSPAAPPATPPDTAQKPDPSKPETVTIRFSEQPKPAPKKREGLPVPAILFGFTLLFLFLSRTRRSS